MTRKHFRKIAAEIALLPRQCDRKNLALTLAPIFRSLNPAFDFGKFYAACEIFRPDDDDDMPDENPAVRIVCSNALTANV